MTLPVYSTSFLQVRGLDGNSPHLVPDGHVWVIRDVWVYAYSATAPSISVEFAGDAGQNIYKWTFLAIDDNPNGFWQGRAVIEVGFQITTNHPTDVSVWGYDLTLP